MDDNESLREPYADPRRANANHTTWIGAVVLALMLIGFGCFAVYNSDRNRSISALMPDATTGQGGPSAGVPATNR